MKIGTLLLSGFTISGHIKIYRYLGLEVGDGDEVVLEFDSAVQSMQDIPLDLMSKYITAMNVTDDGILEIEFVD